MSTQDVVATITPKNGAPFATHWARLGRGGYLGSVADSAARDAIPADRLELDTWVKTRDDGKYWTVSAISPSVTWVELALGGGGGAQDFFTVASAPSLPSVADDGNAAITGDDGAFYVRFSGSWISALKVLQGVYTPFVGFSPEAFAAYSPALLAIGLTEPSSDVMLTATANVSLDGPNVRLINNAYKHLGAIVLDANGNLLPIPYSAGSILSDDVKILLSDGINFGWRNFYGLPAPNGGDLIVGHASFGGSSWNALSAPGGAGYILNSGSGGTPAWSSSPTIAGNLTVQGDLTVQGTHTYVDSTTVQVKDRVVQVNRTTGTAPAPVNICGLSVLRGNDGVSDRDPYGLFWDEANNTWVFAKNTGGDDATLGVDLALRVSSLRVSGLGAGFVRTNGSGVLSSSALVAGDIPDISATYLTVASAGSTYLTISGASSTYATKASLTGTGYFKGAGSFPPSFTTTIPLADIANAGGATGDVTYWNNTTSAWTRIAAVASGSVFVSAGTGTAPTWSNAPTLTGTLTAAGFDAGSGTIVTTGSVSVGTTPATVGRVRLSNGATGSIDGVVFRNGANTANVMGLTINVSDQVQIGGTGFGGLQRAVQVLIDASTQIELRNNGATKLTVANGTTTHNNTTHDIQSGGTSRIKTDGTGIGFFAATPVVKQTSGANLTNNVTAGGTADQVDNWTDLTTYATDAAAIRNAIYQLTKKLKQVNDGLRTYGLLT